MKKLLFTMLLSAMTSAVCATDLDGAHYEGIGKIQGKPTDGWVVVDFDDEDAMFNVANMFNFAGGYTATDAAGTTTLKITVPGAKPSVLKSTDGASTFTGSVTLNGTPIELWLLSVPAEKTPATQSDSELDAIIGSPDGYTCFAQIQMPNGMVGAVTSEFVLNSADHSFRMTCDSPAMQKFFADMHGTYTVSGGKLRLTDAKGASVTADVFESGNYIELPIGQEKGITAKGILIR